MVWPLTHALKAELLNYFTYISGHKAPQAYILLEGLKIKWTSLQGSFVISFTFKVIRGQCIKIYTTLTSCPLSPFL